MIKIVQNKLNLNEVLTSEGWRVLTKGSHDTALNTNKGIEYFKEVCGRTPVISLHTNPFKEDKEHTPWRDLIFQEDGKVIYNGDNKSAKKKAHEPRGNKKLLDVIGLYSSPKKEDRLKAPPIIVTKTVQRNGKKGHRKFIGLGLLNQSPRLVQQYEKKDDAVFSNYQFEIVLISLYPEEEFDWAWIDDRRDPKLDDLEASKRAPRNWKKWINNGSKTIEDIRLKIKSYRLVSIQEQKVMPQRSKKVIDDLLKVYYPDPKKDGLRFEAMASFITTLYFQGSTYKRGWITVGSGDRGVDFVGRLDIGHDEFSHTSIIVLGQSKRYKNAISGESLTRVASRMTRGYIGVVVTLDTITEPAQKEIKEDRLPIILINGKKVAELLLNYMNMTNKRLNDIVEEQDKWMEENIKNIHYNSILDEL